MLCTNCELSEICLVFADIKKHLTYARIELNECKYYQTNKPLIKDEQETVQKNNIDALTGRPTVDRNAIDKASKQKYLEKTKKVKKADVAKPKVNLVAKPLQMDYSCVTCGGLTFKEDHSQCDNCNKDICSCCATVDMDSGRVLCQECWQLT